MVLLFLCILDAYQDIVRKHSLPCFGREKLTLKQSSQNSVIFTPVSNAQSTWLMDSGIAQAWYCGRKHQILLDTALQKQWSDYYVYLQARNEPVYEKYKENKKNINKQTNKQVCTSFAKGFKTHQTRIDVYNFNQFKSVFQK